MALEVREQLFGYPFANIVHISAYFPADQKRLSSNHGCHTLHHDQTTKTPSTAAHFSKTPAKHHIAVAKKNQ
jgi:hypothetical protein